MQSCIIVSYNDKYLNEIWGGGGQNHKSKIWGAMAPLYCGILFVVLCWAVCAINFSCAKSKQNLVGEAECVCDSSLQNLRFGVVITNVFSTAGTYSSNSYLLILT